jgi:hypothetical protein
MTKSWHPRMIGDEIRDQVARLGPDAAIGPIVKAWPDAVGEAIAANAWPARVARDGTLHVATSSSVWAFELTALGETMLEHLQAALGADAPRKIAFAAGRMPERGPSAEELEKPPAPPVSEEHRAEAEAIAAGIENEELRTAVAKAAAASLARTVRPPDDRPL